MAGDWIKMRGNLWDDPQGTRLCDITDQGEAAIVGGLYWLWATADQHSEDGIMPGLTLRGIDRKTGIAGLGDALVAIGWLVDHPDGIRIVGFDEHNGQSAKRRCADAQRKASARNVSACDADKQRTADGQKTSECGAREEKRREEITPTSVGVESASRGTRLPQDFSLPDEWADFCLNERPGLNPEATAQGFADYWRGVAGAKGRKADWFATWRNWVRNQKAQTSAHVPAESFRERDERMARERWEQATGRTSARTNVIDITPAEPGQILEIGQ